MSRKRPTAAAVRMLRRSNQDHPLELRRVPRALWPATKLTILDVWRSRRFLVVAYDGGPGVIRLTINRTDVEGKRWVDGIAWEELQRLKREAGYGDCEAVEIFPRDRDVVNVANMRHLWVLTDAELPFGWKGGA